MALATFGRKRRLQLSFILFFLDVFLWGEFGFSSSTSYWGTLDSFRQLRLSSMRLRQMRGCLKPGRKLISWDNIGKVRTCASSWTLSDFFHATILHFSTGCVLPVTSSVSWQVYIQSFKGFHSHDDNNQVGVTLILNGTQGVKSFQMTQSFSLGAIRSQWSLFDVLLVDTYGGRTRCGQQQWLHLVVDGNGWSPAPIGGLSKQYMFLWHPGVGFQVSRVFSRIIYKSPCQMRIFKVQRFKDVSGAH